MPIVRNVGGRVIKTKTYLNVPGKCHLGRSIGSSVGTYNSIMKKGHNSGCTAKYK